MTLVEFLAPLSGYGKSQARVLAVLYYKEQHENIKALTVDKIRTALQGARMPGAVKINIADILAKAGHAVDITGTENKKRLWSLTESGKGQVRELMGLQAADIEVERDIGTLKLITTIMDAETKDYLQEALKCLGIGALRACIVFVWTGAIRAIQNQVLTFNLILVNAALIKHDPKVRKVTRLDDFAYIKDSLTLLAARELGVLDKNEKDTLEEALNLRNRCGHPSNYKPGVKKTSSFIEDVVSIVFS
jgi:DNA-binding MarR family transcriptional regulator